MKKLFTSESVGKGHPDKICDQISDAILDECLRRDPHSHCAIECYVSTQFLLIGGEVSPSVINLPFEEIARNVIKEIGYDKEEYGFDYKNVEIKNIVKCQSQDINQSVIKKDGNDGAGDQGLMFGYACKETKDYMPLAIYLSHKLVKKADELRLNNKFPHARPDMKSQVTIDYSDEEKPKVNYVLMSIQHDPDIDLNAFRNFIKDNIVLNVLHECGMNDDCTITINPSNIFVIGGPNGDTGLTGRKIIVDTYGGYAHHGGGAFSGKDASKVDRSAAYMARYIAKNLVAAEYCDKLEIQLSYEIGVARPVSVSINTFGTNKCSINKIEEAIMKFFDLTPSGIKKTLKLNNPIYKQTATYGHFGRDDIDLPWEKLDKVELLKSFLEK